MGGEKCGAERKSPSPAGSPPHGRGKAAGERQRPPCPRITPAWAGKSAGLALLLPRAGDHPRMGGEKQVVRLLPAVLLGSPPHGRGKAPLAAVRQSAVWITPAWAGKSPRAPHTTKGHQDHPRMGGEKGHAYKKRQSRGGSPPHGRGKVTRLYALADLEGITPAWAGKSGR